MADKESPTAKDAELLHVPPQHIEAEESLLSAILVDNTALLEVVEILSPADFYRTAHQRIFAAMGDLFNRGEPVDVVTLNNSLKEKGQLEAVGVAAYLARLLDAVPLAVNAQHYARIVHDKAVLRRLIEKANAISKRCFQEQGGADDIIDFAEAAIFEITDNKARQAFYPLSKLINDNINFLEEKQKSKSLVTGVPFHLHFTPTASSWLNLVERWFCELTEKRMRRGSFQSVPSLIDAIREYLANHNQSPRVFVWTAPIEQILLKVARCKEALDALH